MIDTATLWDKCLDDLRYHVKDNVFTMWLRPLSAHQELQTLVIRAPNDYFVSYIKKNHLNDIRQLVVKHSKGNIDEVIVLVDNASQNEQSDENSRREGVAIGSTTEVNDLISINGRNTSSPSLASQKNNLDHVPVDTRVDTSNNQQYTVLADSTDAKSLISLLKPSLQVSQTTLLTKPVTS